MSAVQQVPPGGWQYKEKKTNTTIIGMSKDDLLKCIKNHRKSNGIEEGNVEEDLWAQVKENFPNHPILK